MEVLLPPGFRFKPSDLEIITYLCGYTINQRLPCRFIVEYNLKYFQVEQPPDVSTFGSLGRLYVVTDCSYKKSGARDRQTDDGKGSWKSTDGQERIYNDGQIVGYKQEFRFQIHETGRKKPTSWLMTEYTLDSNDSRNNVKAICVLRNTKGV